MFRQNQLTIMIIAFGIVFVIAGWLFRSEFQRAQNWLISIVVCTLGVLYHIFAKQRARQMILSRRRFYKELWRRQEDDSGKLQLDLNEEEMVVLLGRIKSQGLTVYAMVLVSLVALYFGSNALSYIMAIGILFLPLRLHLMVASLGQSIPNDLENSDLPNHFGYLTHDGLDCFLLQVNIQRIHDFILPPRVLPFWNLQDVEQWLRAVGFQQTRGGNWIGSKAVLKLLDYDEVMEVEPCRDSDVPI